VSEAPPGPLGLPRGAGPGAIQFLNLAGLFASAIFIPRLLELTMEEATPEQVRATTGLVVALYAAATFISSYIFGRASDVYGRRRFLQVGLLLSALAAFGQIFANAVVTIAIARGALGFCAGIFPAALFAYVYENHQSLGRFSAWGAAGWGVGSVLAGVLALQLLEDFDLVFLATGGLLVGATAISFRLPVIPEKRVAVRLFPVELVRRNLRVYLAMLVRHTGANMIWVTYPLFLAELGASDLAIGLIYATNSFGQAFVMGRLDRYRASALVFWGHGLSAATFTVFFFAQTFVEMFPAQLLLATAWSCLYVGSLRYVMDRNPEHGTAGGLFQSVLQLSAMLGPLFGGLAAATLGFRGTILTAAGLAVAGMAIFAAERKR